MPTGRTCPHRHPLTLHVCPTCNDKFLNCAECHPNVTHCFLCTDILPAPPSKVERNRAAANHEESRRQAQYHAIRQQATRRRLRLETRRTGRLWAGTWRSPEYIQAKRTRERQRYQANKETIKARNRAYYHAHKEAINHARRLRRETDQAYRNAQNERNQAYRQSHAAQLAARARERYQEHRAEITRRRQEHNQQQRTQALLHQALDILTHAGYQIQPPAGSASSEYTAQLKQTDLQEKDIPL